MTDGDKAKGQALATRLGEEFVSMRDKTQPDYFNVDEAVRTAIELNHKPVVLAEPTDNAGGGAPSDNTTILRELIAQQATDAAIGPIWDPIAVRLCFDAGLGARFPLRFGGKTGPRSGLPVDATVEVTGLVRDAWHPSVRPRCRSAIAQQCVSAASRRC